MGSGRFVLAHDPRHLDDGQRFFVVDKKHPPRFVEVRIPNDSEYSKAKANALLILNTCRAQGEFACHSYDWKCLDTHAKKWRFWLCDDHGNLVEPRTIAYYQKHVQLVAGDDFIAFAATLFSAALIGCRDVKIDDDAFEVDVALENAVKLAKRLAFRLEEEGCWHHGTFFFETVDEDSDEA